MKSRWYVDFNDEKRPIARLRDVWNEHVYAIAYMTGWRAGPAYWFRSMENRRAIATRRLLHYAEEMELRIFERAFRP